MSVEVGIVIFLISDDTSNNVKKTGHKIDQKELCEFLYIWMLSRVSSCIQRIMLIRIGNQNCYVFTFLLLNNRI